MANLHAEYVSIDELSIRATCFTFNVSTLYCRIAKDRAGDFVLFLYWFLKSALSSSMTYSMKEDLSWEAYSRSVSQEIRRISLCPR
jgi:hypothetical protein